MVTCTYCGASVEPGIETCPDCGANLPPNPKIEIRREPRAEYRAVSPADIFIIQSMPDANYYYLKKNAAAVFVRCLLFCNNFIYAGRP
jgi:hypothetical protein